MDPEKLNVSQSAKMWTVIGVSVVAYDLKCKPGQTLSEGVDRGLEKRPIATTLAVGITCCHLLNILPQRIDPFHQFLKMVKG